MHRSEINFVADIADKRHKMLVNVRIAKLTVASSTLILFGTIFLCCIQQIQARRDLVMAEKQMRIH